MNKSAKIINIILSIVLLPVFIIAIISSVLMFNAKKNNEVPSIFGYSAVQIISESMLDKFKVGDIVMVKKVNTDTIEIGDIIAFYEVIVETEEDLAGPTSAKATTENGAQRAGLWETFGAGVYTSDQQDAADKGSDVWFHRVVDIVSGEDGEGVIHNYFETKGDNNPTNDNYYIKDTMVVGVYSPNANWLGGIFGFCSSVWGILILVLAPAAILIIMLSSSIITQIHELRNEDDVLATQYSGVSEKPIFEKYKEDEIEPIVKIASMEKEVPPRKEPPQRPNIPQYIATPPKKEPPIPPRMPPKMPPKK